MNPAFWRGRRVFLTGHTGFKGGWLSLWLQELGADVSGYALAPATTPSLFDVAGVGAGMASTIADIRELLPLQAALAAARPEVVIHLAAQPLVRYSYAQPVETYATNVMGTVHLLESVRQTPGVRAVVVVTTDKCYDNREWVWGYRESDPLGGYDPYSSSKAGAEIVTAAYRSSYFNPADYARHGVAVASVRAGNVIGGGDWSADRLVPDIVAAFAAGRPVAIRNPHATRPWQHVLEPLRAYLMLAQALVEQGPALAEAWNVGPRDDDARPVAWIVERLASLWGDGATWTSDAAPQPHEAGWLKLDISRIVNRLGWRPALDLDAGLRLVVDWCRAREAGADMRRFTLDQIRAYQSLTG